MTFRVAGAQLNAVVGDIRGNERRILEAMKDAADRGADILLTPELALTGYPPEDLVHRPDFVAANLEALQRLAEATGEMAVVVGHLDPTAEGTHAGAPDARPRDVANAASLLQHGRIVGTYHKVVLPNYGVFDEDRNFAAGTEPDLVWEVGDTTVGISVCEDIWLPDGPPSRQAAAGARILLNINASPYHRGKARERESMLAERARASAATVVYVNLVGGQDELVFDGASVVIGPDGEVVHRSPQFEEDLFVTDLETGTVAPLMDPIEEVYTALVVGVRDYVRKNGFTAVAVGLSGGIDSAVTATIAADALGPGNVWALAMPSRYSSRHSVEDALALAANLGIRCDVVPIEPMHASYLETLHELFGEEDLGVTEENLQARIRGNLLMAISNHHRHLVLTTGNKSETAVGYATLYGDMVGGYAPLKDVFKTLVYELARWRNRDGEVVPEGTLTKPPSAELRPGQTDQDTLPPYEELDRILELYVEQDMGPEKIVAQGFDPETVGRVVAMVDRSEYKRRQGAPGPKITTKAFGKDRRLPMTNAYRAEPR
ncbi:MAG TPA: NAD+ synthase [Acidimicrobiia bacterium]